MKGLGEVNSDDGQMRLRDDFERSRSILFLCGLNVSRSKICFENGQ